MVEDRTKPAANDVRRRNPMTGWISYDAYGKPYSVPERIDESFQDMQRFVSQSLGISLADIRGMNVFEFFRDLDRAQKVYEARKRAMERK